MTDSESEPILRAENLTKYYDSSEGFIDSLLGRTQWVQAVDGIDIELTEGETLGIVGESGCGKTTLGRTMLQLVEPTDGSVHYRGTDLTEVSSTEMRNLRKDLQYIFQDPFSSLNPRLTVGDIIEEPLEIHDWPWTDPDIGTRADVRTDGVSASSLSVSVDDDIDKLVDPVDGVSTVHVTVRTGNDGRSEYESSVDTSDGIVAEVEEDLTVTVDRTGDEIDVRVSVSRSTAELRQERIYELLETVGLNPSHTNRYPHEFSGGQRQRIGIARALAVDPEVIVCDEPVSALDVSVQAQILNLLEDLQEEFGLSYIFIAHDLSVVEHISDRIAVMYLGEIAEIGTTEEVFSPPHHPYTEALLSAIPEPDPLWVGEQILLSGTVPSPLDPPSGCRFHTRCPSVIQPEAYDLPQEVWRSVLNLKQRVAGAETVESIAATDDSRAENAERTDPTEVPKDELDDLVRAEFDLPRPLPDPGVEQRLSEAVDQLYEERIDDAYGRLEALESPCEAHRPEQVPDSETHEISCLLYDHRYDEGELPPSNETSNDAAADD